MVQQKGHRELKQASRNGEVLDLLQEAPYGQGRAGHPHKDAKQDDEHCYATQLASGDLHGLEQIGMLAVDLLVDPPVNAQQSQKGYQASHEALYETL